MKKLITMCAALAVVSVLSTSCNKKLKENMEELETSLDEQKSKNEELQTQVNTLNNAIVRPALTANFSTTDDDGYAVTMSGEYSFSMGSEFDNAFMMDLNNGSYYIYVERSANLGDKYASISFVYTPGTGVINPYAEVDGYGSRGQYIETEFDGSVDITQTVTVSAFDFGAGTISFNYSGSTTADYSDNAYPGKTMSLTLSYSGALAKYYEPML